MCYINVLQKNDIYISNIMLYTDDVSLGKNLKNRGNVMKVVAIVGCGRIANNAHLPALSHLDDVRIK